MELVHTSAILGGGLLALWLIPRLARRWELFSPRPRVLVALKTGETVAGILLNRRRAVLVLGDVTVHERGAGAEPVRADGSVYIDQSNVRWVQRPEA